MTSEADEVCGDSPLPDLHGLYISCMTKVFQGGFFLTNRANEMTEQPPTIKYNFFFKNKKTHDISKAVSVMDFESWWLEGCHSKSVGLRGKKCCILQSLTTR